MLIKKEQMVNLDNNQIMWKRSVMNSFKSKGQGALHLSTSLGKSYIAKSIIDDILYNSAIKGKSDKVIWISSKAAVDNVKSNIFGVSDEQTEFIINEHNEPEYNMYYNLHFINFELIRLHHKYIDELNLDNVKLIVIDEAHLALAEETYKGVKYILDKFTAKKGCNLLVMTASGIRSCDGVDVFKTLVPKLEAVTDYDVADLTEALDRNLLCEVKFINSNIYKLKLMLEKLNEKKAQSEQEQKEVAEMLEYLTNYTDNIEVKLGEDLNKHLQSVYSARDLDKKTKIAHGNQWLVFFGTTAEAKKSEEFLVKLFENAYKHNDKVNINVYQYHNAMNEEHNKIVLDIMNTVPEENTVNVFVTVNKGLMSIHPKNVVGEIQFRSTTSINLYEQAIGRTLKPKEYSDGPVFVVDVVGNYKSVETFSNDKLSKVINDDKKIEDKFKDVFSSSISFIDMNDTFSKIIKDYDEYIHLLNIEDSIDELVKFFKDNGIDTSKWRFGDISPLLVLNKVRNDIATEYGVSLYANKVYEDDEADKHIDFDMLAEEDADILYVNENSITKKYKTVKESNNTETTGIDKKAIELMDRIDYLKSIIIAVCDSVASGQLGSLTINKLNNTCSSYKDIYMKLGDMIFFNNIGSINPYDLNRIRIGVEEYEYNYKRINKTKELKQSLNDLREKFLNNELSPSIIAYCKFYNIDIIGDETDIVEIALNNSKLKEEIIEEFRKLKKLLKQSINNEDKTTEAFAYYLILKSKYKCDGLFNAFDEQFDIKEMQKKYEANTRAFNIAKCMKIATDKRGNNIYDTSKIDSYLIKVAHAISTRQKFTQLETLILKYYNVNVNSSWVKIESDNVMNLTSLRVLRDKLNRIDELEDKEKSFCIEKLKQVQTFSLPSAWEKEFEQFKSELIHKANVVELTPTDLIKDFEEKMVEMLDDKNFEHCSKILNTKANKCFSSGISVEKLMSVCFEPSYREYMETALNHMLKDECDEDDIIVLEGVTSAGDNYSSKLGFLLASNILKNGYDRVASKIISKQFN